MTPPNPILLMTRTPDASARFCDQLPGDVRVRLDLCVSPLIEIAAIGGEIEFADAVAIIFTSANGVAMALRRTSRRHLPAVCVGEATTEAARVAGWQARCLGASADELVQSLLQERATGPMLHLSGIHTRGRIAERLSDAGCPTRSQPIYDQVLRPLGADAVLLLSGSRPVIAPVFSPRTARRLAEQAPVSAHLHLIALSPAVAEPLSDLAASSLDIAEYPDAASMAVCVQSVLNRLCRVESSRSAQ